VLGSDRNSRLTLSSCLFKAGAQLRVREGSCVVRACTIASTVSEGAQHWREMQGCPI
jgi:hypothetical protein